MAKQKLSRETAADKRPPEDANIDPIVNGDPTNVTNTEKELLREAAGHPVNAETEDRDQLALDDTDEDGDPLEEESVPELGGEDLDIPGSELDDEDEDFGEEDEENNGYSLPD